MMKFESFSGGIDDAAKSALAALSALKSAHWATGKYSEHVALGGAYDAISALTDRFIECAMGKTGSKPATEDAMSVLEDAVDAMSAVAEGHSELVNIVDEIKAERDKLAYLMTLK